MAKRKNEEMLDALCALDPRLHSTEEQLMAFAKMYNVKAALCAVGFKPRTNATLFTPEYYEAFRRACVTDLLDRKLAATAQGMREEMDRRCQKLWEDLRRYSSEKDDEYPWREPEEEPEEPEDQGIGYNGFGWSE